MTTIISGTTGITYPDGSSQSGVSIPSGSRTNFFNAAAPTGWTQVTTYNDYAMRIVSGTGAGTGGSVAFTTAFANGNAGATTLSTTQIPAHAHNIYAASGGVSSVLSLFSGSANTAAGANNASSFLTQNTYSVGGAQIIQNTGGGGSHTHSLSLAVQYIDSILCQKS